MVNDRRAEHQRRDRIDAGNRGAWKGIHSLSNERARNASSVSRSRMLNDQRHEIVVKQPEFLPAAFDVPRKGIVKASQCGTIQESVIGGPRDCQDLCRVDGR